MTFTQAMDAAAVELGSLASSPLSTEDRMRLASLWMQYAQQLEFRERSSGVLSGWQAQTLSAQAQEHIRTVVAQAGTQEDAS